MHVKQARCRVVVVVIYLLINCHRILRCTFPLAHFNAVGRKEFAREDIAVGDVKYDTVELDIVADIKILP